MLILSESALLMSVVQLCVVMMHTAWRCHV